MMGRRQTRESSRSRLALALGGALLLGLLAVPAQALVVTVDLGWGYNVAGGADLSDYNLQVGSIVQVIMYNSGTAAAPGSDADDNFTIYYGNYPGAGIAAEPYPGTEPANVPGDTTMYDPNSTPAGHLLAYTATIQAAPYLDDNGNTWYQIYAQFEVLGTYDSLYIRVFGATDFPPMEVVASYWGLSGVQQGTNIIDTWYVGPLDNTTANRTNYFEVIPEPGSLSLLALGGAGLLAGARRRRKRARGG